MSVASSKATMDNPFSQRVEALSALETDERNLAFIIYVLMCLSPLSLGITALIGVGLAYIKKNNCSTFVQTHFRYQIKSFWVAFVIWALATFIAVLCTGFTIFTFTNLILSQTGIANWQTLQFDLTRLDLSRLSVPAMLAIVAGFCISAGLTVLATLWMLFASVRGFLRLNDHKPIGKRFVRA
ncbi:MAG: hypothetical protein QM645_09125 [Asticcacaulis sp.]